jgi:hypothetical protein
MRMPLRGANSFPCLVVTQMQTCVLRDSPQGGLLREPNDAFGALAPIPERRVASSAFCWGEVGIEDRTLLVPLHPLGARHLTNH